MQTILERRDELAERKLWTAFWSFDYQFSHGRVLASTKRSSVTCRDCALINSPETHVQNLCAIGMGDSSACLKSELQIGITMETFVGELKAILLQKLGDGHS